MSRSTDKPWYKKWWGVIIAILIWPFFLLWFIWSQSSKGKALKVISSIGVVVLAFIVLSSFVNSMGKVKTTNSVQPISLASLNTKAGLILANATNNTEKQMATGQADAKQSNALTANSAFEKWRTSVEKTTDSNTDNAYNQAAAIYTSNNQPVPSSLIAWKKDNFNAYSDIGVWQLMEATVLVDNQGGSSASSVASDKSTLTLDYNAYLKDIGKAITDIRNVSPSVKINQPTSNIASSSPAAPKTTVSISSLNAQAVSLFNPVLADLEQQMATGQADAQQSNAGNVNSAFHTWETNESDKQNVANNNEVTKAFNTADNAYYAAHQTAPNALNNWDNDAGNLPGDISGWASAEQTVLGDEVMGSSSLSSDQKAATTALQQYQSDLAKAKADIQQL